MAVISERYAQKLLSTGKAKVLGERPAPSKRYEHPDYKFIAIERCESGKVDYYPVVNREETKKLGILELLLVRPYPGPKAQ